MPAVTQYPENVINLARKMRKAGKTYRQISRDLRKHYSKPIGAGTISHWVRAQKDGVRLATSLPRAELVKQLAGYIESQGRVLAWKDYKRLCPTPGAWEKHFKSWTGFQREALKQVPDSIKANPDRVFALIKVKPLTPSQVAESLAITLPGVKQAIERARAQGYNIHQRGEHYHVEHAPGPRAYDPKLHEIVSDANGVIRFGVTTDNHIGSKYARLDVLNWLYDEFAREGITRVYNCGNWIDGEARFNRHDLESWAHGMDNQLRGFAEHFPRRPGINTYYVAGDDHEGWYDGVDVGLRAQQTAREMGRTDLHYLGYMEAYIRLRHKKTGNSSVMAVIHPGGGSAYALSYSPQKVVESYQGGEKPAVAVFGHWHKMDVFNYRNVWIVQAGCTQDQTPFMRKRRIEAHVGGVIVELRLDARGAIPRCKTDQIRYFDRGFYNFQFDRANPIRRQPLTA